jgi:eukaryotic-like serine/threonine-protein kinase
MPPEGLDRVFAVFDAAVGLPEAERDAYLASECGDDAQLREEVQSLLAAHDEAGGFLSGRRSHDREIDIIEPGSAAPILTPGTRLGVFTIEKFIGAGGMGEVYKARDMRLDRIVALKLLPSQMAADAQARARLEREARSISRLNHPHICTLHDLGSASPGEGGTELSFLVMEHLDGETLAERLRRGPLSIDEALHHAIALAGALAAAHAEGIVHRDLKPANIMLVSAGAALDSLPEAKLLDFGLARLQQTAQISDAGPPVTGQSGLTARGMIAGTLPYLSPEQVRGEEADARSDIFAFGSVLYEMMTGRSAFGGTTPDDVMAAIVSTDPLSLPPWRSQARLRLRTTGVPRRLESVLRRCLEKAPDQRFGRMLDVKAELQQVGPTATGRLSRRQAIAAVAGVLTLMIAAAAWFRVSRESAVAPSAPMKTVQLTALNGLELAPALSPDGNQVAFSWNGEKEDNFDIYVKTIGSSEVRRLTTDPAVDTLPAWSPDGQQIAYLREQRDYGAILWSVSPAGGGDRKLTDYRVGSGVSARIAWSPDGRAIVARPDLTEDLGKQGNWAFYLIPIGGGPPRRLTTAKAPDLDVAPAFAPDGRQFAYSACVTATRRTCDVNVVDLGADYTPTALPRRLTHVSQSILGVAWSRDAKSIVYGTSGGGRAELWRVRLGAAADPERLEIAGDHARQPSIVAVRDRLVFERNDQLRSVYRLRPNDAPEPVLVSSAWDYNPTFSPDGRRLAFGSRRSGGGEDIWLAAADGSGARQLTHGPGNRQTAPAWSPDGRLIAFESSGADGHSDIWVIESNGGTPRRVTTDPAEENAPSWSRDGKRIYFLSDRGGRDIFGGHDTWQVSVDGGPAARVTDGGSNLLAFESADGKTLIYQTLGDSPLMAVPVGGGAARELVPCAKTLSFTVGAAGVYYSPCGNRRDRAPNSGLLQTWQPRADIPIQLLDVSTGRVRVVATVKEPFEPTRLAVSPDGKTILVHRNMSTSDLMLIENFR